jgi:bacillithiol biosynthesis deacetylase BshB1
VILHRENWVPDDQQKHASQKLRKHKRSLGITVRENLNMADGYFQHNEENINKLVRIIRKYQPEIVLANAPQDRHPDHGRAAKLIADACFYAWLIKIDTQQEARRPKAVYHYIQDQNLTADFVVDITPYMDQKIQAVLAYQSQFYNAESDEPETPISSKEFLESVKAKNISIRQTYRRSLWRMIYSQQNSRSKQYLWSHLITYEYRNSLLPYFLREWYSSNRIGSSTRC